MVLSVSVCEREDAICSTSERVRYCTIFWAVSWWYANSPSSSIIHADVAEGDYLLAHKLLSDSVHTLRMCEDNPQIDIGTNRLLILFTGISPFRANMVRLAIPPLMNKCF